ncbi:MAG: 5'-deoxynucleotidase [Eubacterium sp.]|nr:5'-deoxynucleotidase [Eubacterium sp.]
MYGFYAMMARMKYIERWALMRNSREENLSEHSLEVAMLAHSLAIISKERLGIDVDPARVALMGIFHDANEIITGDMPTPVKYYDDDIHASYKRVENIASHTLLNKLPSDMKKYYDPLLLGEEEALKVIDSIEGNLTEALSDGKADEKMLEAYGWKLVKAADKFSALIKCMEEIRSGNREFDSAYDTTLGYLEATDLDAVNIFMDEFLPAYDLTLDELQQ